MSSFAYDLFSCSDTMLIRSEEPMELADPMPKPTELADPMPEPTELDRVVDPKPEPTELADPADSVEVVLCTIM